MCTTGFQHQPADGSYLKPVLSVAQSRLARYLQRLRRDLASLHQVLFLAEVHCKSCRKQLGKVGKVAKADNTVHPIRWSAYDATAQLSAIISEERLNSHVESEKTNGITD